RQRIVLAESVYGNRVGDFRMVDHELHTPVYFFRAIPGTWDQDQVPGQLYEPLTKVI
ncbi:MAG: hypothetical protein GTO42_10715, partial [Candidatus Latescibacteria bacterium]|nr:hypothetical protein [Candidatus Latescibacterota bacterium]